MFRKLFSLFNKARKQTDNSTFEPLYIAEGLDQNRFNFLLTLIKEAPAYKDRSAKIKIDSEKRIIYFGHSLREIRAAFPKVMNFFLGKYPATETNLHHYAAGFLRACKESIEIQQQELKKNAVAYFENPPEMKHADKVMTSPLPDDPNEAFLDLLSKNQGVVIGEYYHQDQSAKALLMNNMKTIKAKNSKIVIFFEHLLEDTQSELLQLYFQPQTKTMPRMLQDYLADIDWGFNVTKPNSFSNLVRTAKENDIQLIPIDTIASYSITDFNLGDKNSAKDRSLMMNYSAALKIQEYLTKNPDGKYIVFCGAAHLNKNYRHIPGIGELTGCPTILVKDLTKEPALTKERIAKPDVEITMDTLSKTAKIIQHSATVKEYKPNKLGLR